MSRILREREPEVGSIPTAGAMGDIARTKNEQQWSKK